MSEHHTSPRDVERGFGCLILAALTLFSTAVIVVIVLAVVKS